MDINFDIAGAKKAGATDSDLSNYFKTNYNIDFDFGGAYKAGASDEDVLNYLNQNYGSVKKKVGGEVSVPIPSKLPSKSYLSEGDKMAQRGFEVAPNTISEGVSKDSTKDESVLAGIYNSIVDRVGSVVGGVASSEAMNPAAKIFKGISTKFKEAIAGKPAISEEGKVSPLQTKIDEKAWREAASGLVEKARSAKSSKEFEKKSSQFDVFDGGISMQDVKGMAFQAPSQLIDMAMGAFTGGGSFLAQSWNDNAKDLEENPNAAKLTDNQKFGYLYLQSLTQAALEKFSLDKITKNTGLTKKVQQKIASEVIDEFVQKGIKATGREVEDAIINKASKLINKIKNVGIKAATGFITEGGTEGAQQMASDAIKLVTNKIAKHDIFDEQDIKDNFIKNAVNSAVMGGVMGGVLGGFGAGLSNTNKAIRKQISEIQSPEELKAVQTQINEQVELGNITPEEAQAANIKAQDYAQIAAKIPSEINPEKKYLIIGGIEQRNALKSDIDKLNTEMQGMDESLQKDKKSQVELLQAKLDQVDDHINTIVSGEAPEYIEKDGNYFKVIDGEEVKISKPYYELAKAAEEENNRKNEEYLKGVELVEPTEAEILDDLRNKRFASFTYKSEEEVPDVFKDKIVTRGENTLPDGTVEKFVRVTVPQSLADYELAKAEAVGVKDVRRIISPSKPISEMNSEELGDFATETRRALKKQDKDFEGKTEKEKEEGGYYDVIDEVEDLRDASERINFIENAEDINDLANSIKSTLSNIKGENPNEYQLAILNAAKNKATELGIDPKDLIKNIGSKIANQFKDVEDAELMVKSALEKLIPKAVAQPLPSEEAKLTETKVEPTEINGLKVIERIQDTAEGEPMYKVEGDKYLTESGKEVKVAEPRTIVTISGMTEEERQAAIKNRKAKTNATPEVLKQNKLLQDVRSYFKQTLPQQRKDLATLNRLRLRAQEMGLVIDKGSLKKKTVTQGAIGKMTVLSRVSYQGKAEGNTSIDESGKTLRERSQEVQDLFNEFNDKDIFLDFKGTDGRRLSAEQMEATMQDIVDGIPSKSANAYLDFLENSINKNEFNFYDKNLGEVGATLEELRALEQKEQIGEPMSEEDLNSFLSEEAKYTPEEEQELIDNIENLLYDYETKEGGIKEEARPAAAEPKEAIPTKAEPVVSAEKAGITGTLAEDYENLPDTKTLRKNAIKALINDNFDKIKEQLENKKICQ